MLHDKEAFVKSVVIPNIGSSLILQHKQRFSFHSRHFDS